mmetsp:Transcript_9701/g.22830  ORF Transcript_9701/g.22830 Transcript_9701/m.22830 type:complete len:1068 (-) Transcript_9701:1411-4614(-)
MAVEKLNRALSHRIFVSLICLLPFVESYGGALSLQFNNCDPNSNKCIQCWNADVVNGSHPKEASNITETSCISPDMAFEISKGSTEKLYDWNGTPKGWLVHDRDDFRIAVKASVGWIDSSQFSRVAFEVQLCNIDNIMLCQPVIAPNSFFDDITTIDDIQNLRTTRTPSATRFVDLDMVVGDTVEEELNFGRILSAGTYRILTSLVVSNTSTVSGVSMISDVKYLNVIHNDPKELSSESYTAIIVMSAIASTVILFLLFQTFTYRNAQVFQLTQGKFIMAMQLCALIASCSLILFIPDDPYCQLSPLTYLSTHTVYAILLGRMWRVRAVISPLLLLTLERKDDRTTQIVDFISRLTSCTRWQEKQQKKIRMQITDYQLARVIMLLVVPQLLIQLLILGVYHGNQSILVDIVWDGVVEGIYICEYGPFYSTLHVIAVSLIGCEFFLLAFLMWGSRDLPSLFNETKKVWQILRATFVFVLSGTLLIAATIDHYNTAQVRVLVPAFVLGLNMCQTCWVITWSKLKVAWRGQPILVTKLIADHNFNRGKSEAMGMGVGSTKYFESPLAGKDFSGYQPALKTETETETNQSQTTGGVEEEPSIDIFKEDNQTENIESDDRSTDSSVFIAESQETVADLEDSEQNGAEGVAPPGSEDSVSLVDASTRSTFSPLKFFRRDKGGSNASRDSLGSSAAFTRGSIPRGSMVVRRRLVGRSSTIPSNDERPSKSRFSVFGHSSMPASVVVESIDMNPRLSRDKIRISETQAPGRRLLLRMIDVQRMLGRVNTSLLTGESLDRGDWEELRGGCVALGEVFENEVVFAWDNDDDSQAASHASLQRRPQGHRPGNGQFHSSLPPKSRVTNTTNAGVNRRNVTFSASATTAPKEKEVILGSMLRKPLEPIMSIRSPVMREKKSVPGSSGVDEIHELNDVRVNGSGLQGAQPQSPNDSHESLAKHRVVRPNANASLPANLPIDQVPLGGFKEGSTLPTRMDVSESEKSEPTSDLIANTSVAIDQIPMGQFQRGRKLARVSGISNSSDTAHGSSHEFSSPDGSNEFESMSTLGESDHDLREIES